MWKTRPGLGLGFVSEQAMAGRLARARCGRLARARCGRLGKG